MEHESSRANSGPFTTGPINRRTFGQTLGMATLAGTLRGLAGTVSAQRGNATPTDELCDLSAIDLVAKIRPGNLQKEIAVQGPEGKEAW